MSVKKSPLMRVKDQFGTKEKLVDALVALPAQVIERGEEDKEAYHKRMMAAANSKLLRLYQTGKAVAERWGSKEALVDALLQLQSRGKDQDYKTKLSTQTVGKLYDRFQSMERAHKRAQAKA